MFVFVSLPLVQLDEISLKTKLRDIGQMEGATNPDPRSAQMAEHSLARRLAAEALGTGLLLATVIGSGIMGAKLAGGNVALALLGNTIPTGAMLVVLILIFGPISGAHVNPAVSIAFGMRGDLRWREVWLYTASQIAGGVLGAWTAHVMFELPIWQLSTTTRTGTGQWFAETVATFGLLLTIFGCAVRAPSATPYAVGLYITAASWFTASTSFANPAVTIARSLTDTFAGIAPANAASFIVAQLLGMTFAYLVAEFLWPPHERARSSPAA